MKKKNTVKHVFVFTNTEKPKLNLTDKNEISIFEGNDKKKKRTRHPILNIHNYLDHSLQRV